MNKALIFLIFLLPGCVFWMSCGSPASSGARVSGLKYRAFVSNSVSAGTSIAGVYIVDAQNDVHPLLSPIGAGNTPGMMVVTPNRAETIVFSGSGTQSSDNQLTFIANATESDAGHVILPGGTESIVVSPDSSTGYVAIPTAPVVGQSPGVVDVLSLTTGNFTGEVDVPAVRFLSINNGGNRVLGFSDNSDSVAVITPSNVGIGTAVTYISGFDRPVAAFFSSDDNTAFVLNCGAECGGNQASVQKLDMTTGTLVGPAVGLCTTDVVPQCAGTIALVDGSTMYVAGTPHSPGGGPSLLCASGTTQAQYCGLLTVFNLNTMTVTATLPNITDGYHNRIALASGQLFIGARSCTEIIPPVSPPAGAESRGCLSIYNTLGTAVGNVAPSSVVIPPVTGDVTGIQPIVTRQVVYLVQGRNVQGGTLYIYDTTTDALFNNPHDSTLGEIFGLVGDFYDVKTVDF